MKTGLNVAERLTLMGILPKEGNFVTLRMIRTLADKVGISAKEMVDFEVKEADGRVQWNEKGTAPTELEFLDAEVDLIKKELKRLDSENKLNQNSVALYEKFCG